jgi:hypothetical protein
MATDDYETTKIILIKKCNRRSSVTERGNTNWVDFRGDGYNLYVPMPLRMYAYITLRNVLLTSRNSKKILWSVLTMTKSNYWLAVTIFAVLNSFFFFFFFTSWLSQIMAGRFRMLLPFSRLLRSRDSFWLVLIHSKSLKMFLPQYVTLHG